MTDSNAITQQKTSFLETLLEELWKLLPQISFSAEKGGYLKGKSVCVLVDKRPGAQPDTFDAGLTVCPLTDQPLELADIGIATTGSVEGFPHVRPLRRGITNKRGCITLTDLPIGQYRLYLAKSVVSSQIPLPWFSISEHYQAADGSLSCFLRETRGAELVLDFEAFPPEEEGDVWVEYVIVEQDSERIVQIEREGQQTELAGRLALRPDKGGRYAARLSLGRHISIPPHARCGSIRYQAHQLRTGKTVEAIEILLRCQRKITLLSAPPPYTLFSSQRDSFRLLSAVPRSALRDLPQPQAASHHESVPAIRREADNARGG